MRLVGVGLGQAAAAIATALLVEAAFNRLIAGSVGAAPLDRAAFASVSAGLLGAAAVGAALRTAERVQAERLGQDYVYLVRLVLYDRLATLAPRTLQRRSQGGVALRFVGDLTALRQWVSLGLARLVVGGTMIAGALVALAIISPVLAAGLAVVLALGGAGVLGLAGLVRTAAADARRRRARLAANVNQQVGAIAVVQAFGQGGRERRRVARQARQLREASVARARAAGRLQGVAEATAALATGVVLLLGAIEVDTGRTDVGTIVAALAIVGLLAQPLRDLSRVAEYRQNAVVSREKLQRFLETSSPVAEEGGVPDLLPGPGRLEFDGVTIAGGLQGVSAVAEPGTVVAVVGSNGSGKSTLLGLAARLVESEAGAVRLDGQDLAAHSLASVHRAVSMAAPDLPLLRGSIDRNLRYRWPEAPEAELARVRTLCGVDEVLASLPDGIATRVAEDGKGLSSGQRQRIALARALLGDPTVLLLDEADANLDPAASAAIERVVAAFRGTVLLATHRRERAAADAIWHLEAGSLVAVGAPASVLASAGPTARLFRPGTDEPGSGSGGDHPTGRPHRDAYREATLAPAAPTP